MIISFSAYLDDSGLYNFIPKCRINKSSGQHGSTEDFTSADADRQSGISESFSGNNPNF